MCAGITTDVCFPYTAGNGNAPACASTCQDGSAMKYFKAKNAYQLRSETDIMTDIYTNGPVEAGRKKKHGVGSTGLRIQRRLQRVQIIHVIQVWSIHEEVV